MHLSHKRSLSEGTILLTASKIFGQFSAIAYLFIVLSQLSVVEYGLVKLAFSIPLLLAFFSLSGLQPVLVSDLISLKEKGDIKRMRYLISSTVSLKFILAILTSLGLFFSTFLFQTWFSSEVLNMVRLLCLMLLFGPIRAQILLSFTLMKNFRALASISLIEELLKLITVAVLLLSYNLGAFGVIAATVITDLLIIPLFFFSILRLRNGFLEGKFFSKGVFDPLFVIQGHAKWAIFLSGLNSFSTNIRPWIIQFVLGTQAVGIYALALTLAQPLQSVVPIARVINPILPSYKDKPRQMSRLINISMRYKLLSQLLLTISACAVLPVLIYYAFPDYDEAFWLFVAIASAFIPKACSQIYSAVFHVFKLQKNLFGSYVTNLLLVISVLPISLYVFGLYGVAIELFVTQLAFLFGRYKVIKKSVPSYEFHVKDFYTFNETDRWLLKKIKEKSQFGTFTNIKNRT